MGSPVQLSVLDRLIDRDPGNPNDPTLTSTQTVRAAKAAVGRDLEWLLNTRRVAAEIPEEFEELPSSVFAYGLPDISSMSADSHDVASRLRRHVQETLERFEPRLTNVQVALVESVEGRRHLLHFVVDGLLQLDPSPEHVQFDTVLELSSGKFDLSGE